MPARYYQLECVSAIFDYLSKYPGNPICALPTGTGKSYVIAELLRQMFTQYPALRVLMATHVGELVEQNVAELQGLWPMAPVGIYSAGLGKKEIRPITFATIKSILNGADELGWVDIVIVDECHLFSPEDNTSYQLLMAGLQAKNPNLRLIGLSATPYRLGQGMLTHPIWRNDAWQPSIFSDVCYDITQRESFNRLIDEGYLAMLVPKATDTKIDVSEVAIRGGEFVQGELQDAVDKDEITYAAVRETIILGKDRKHWLCFGTGSRHCEHITKMFIQCGVSAVCVHSKTKKSDRVEALRKFRSGEARVLVNNIIYSVGFNFKPIDLLVDMQPTNSTSRHVQKYGRGTRPSPETGKQDCLVLDFSGNTGRLGPINDPKIPSSRKPGERNNDEREAPVKVCPKCNSYVHSSNRWCKCGHEFPYARPELTATADTLEIVATTGARFQEYTVTSVEYARHLSKHQDKPDSLKVIYRCGPIQSWVEWVCLDHKGYPGVRARDWWRECSAREEVPANLDEALQQRSKLRQATHIRVWTNCDPPKITDRDYSGTMFGKIEKKF